MTAERRKIQKQIRLLKNEHDDFATILTAFDIVLDNMSKSQIRIPDELISQRDAIAGSMAEVKFDLADKKGELERC